MDPHRQAMVRWISRSSRAHGTYGGIELTKMTRKDWRALKYFDDDGSGVLEMEELLGILMHTPTAGPRG